ncbi:MAG: hypothetical protein Q4F24_04255 [Eubacteriales bacterium]|nr:hypothetical protein [Eubacteriales bacterium]
MCPDFCYIFPDMVIGTIKENSLTNEKHEAVTSTNLTLMKRLFVTNGQSRKSDRNLYPVHEKQLQDLYKEKQSKEKGYSSEFQGNIPPILSLKIRKCKKIDIE